jgi:anti-sigma regulatory factor (Ser/Thr protein kinase)
VVDEVLELEIEADPRSSSRARRSVASWLAAKDFPGEQLDDWLIVVSEIVTNAVLHARTPSRIVVRWNGRRVLVEVFDGRADELPNVRDEPPAVGGRGLFLVEQLSTEWGVESVPSGKCVWATLETAP